MLTVDQNNSTGDTVCDHRYWTDLLLTADQSDSADADSGSK